MKKATVVAGLGSERAERRESIGWQADGKGVLSPGTQYIIGQSLLPTSATGFI